MPQVTIHITDGPRGAVVNTDGERPAIGRLQTPAQALAMDLLRACGHQASDVRYGAEQVPTHRFLRELLDPEALGHAVTPEVRDRARELLGQVPVERKDRMVRPGGGFQTRGS